MTIHPAHDIETLLSPEWRAGFLTGRAKTRAWFAEHAEDDTERRRHLAEQARLEAQAIEEARE